MSNDKGKLPWESDNAVPEGTSAWKMPEWNPDKSTQDDGAAEPDLEVGDPNLNNGSAEDFPVIADDTGEDVGQENPDEPAFEDAPTEYLPYGHDSTPTGAFPPVQDKQEAWSDTEWAAQQGHDDGAQEHQDYPDESTVYDQPDPPSYREDPQYQDDDGVQEVLGAAAVDDDVLEDNAILAEEARASRDKAKYASIAAVVAIILALLFGALWMGAKSGNADLQNEAASSSTSKAQLEDRVNSLTKERDALIKERDKARGDLNRTREDKGRAEREANNLRGTVDSQNEQLSSLNEANSTLGEEVREKNERIKAMDEDIKRLEKQIEDFRRVRDKPATTETETATVTETVVREVSSPPVTRTITEPAPAQPAPAQSGVSN